MKKQKKSIVYFNPGDICYNQCRAASPKSKPVIIIKLSNKQAPNYIVECLTDEINDDPVIVKKKGEQFRIHGSWLVPAQTQKCPLYLQ